MKKIALIMVALLLAVSLIACNNTEADDNGSGSVADTKKDVKTLEVSGTKGESEDIVTVGSITYDDEKGKNVVITEYTANIATEHTVKLVSKVVHDNTEYTVTKIGDEAFRFRASITKIELPSTITHIGYQAFAGCEGLTEIEIPASVKYIGNGAFAACTNLKTVTFAEGSQLVGIDAQAFANCTSLENITIPEGVETIGVGAFYNCASITSLKTPSTLKSIDKGAFMGCTGLNQPGALDVSASVNIETKVETVGGEKVEIVCLGEQIFGNINRDYIIVPEDKESEIYKYLFPQATEEK